MCIRCDCDCDCVCMCIYMCREILYTIYTIYPILYTSHIYSLTHSSTYTHTHTYSGEVQRFKRAVLLLRDPFDSIWSEYQRRVSGTHVGLISGIKTRDHENSGTNEEKKTLAKSNPASFDWARWCVYAGILSHEYIVMWKQYEYILQVLLCIYVYVIVCIRCDCVYMIVCVCICI